LDSGRFGEAAALIVGKQNEGDAGEDSVRAAGEKPEHCTRFFRRFWLVQHFAFADNRGVRSNHNDRAYRASGSQVGFGVGESKNETSRFFTRQRCFIYCG